MNVQRIGQKIKAAEFSVKVEDVYNLKDLYKVVKEWMDEENYFDDHGTESYREKLFLQKDRPTNTELWIWFRTIKYPEGVNPKTGYLRYLLDIDYHIVNMKDLEVVHKGRKMKMNKGETEVMISANVELDYRGEWKKHNILKNFITMFQKSIYKNEIDYHRLALYKEAYKLQAVIKRYLEAKGMFSPEEIRSYSKRSFD